MRDATNRAMSAENANFKQFLIVDELGYSRLQMMNVLCERSLAERVRAGLSFLARARSITLCCLCSH